MSQVDEGMGLFAMMSAVNVGDMRRGDKSRLIGGSQMKKIKDKAAKNNLNIVQREKLAKQKFQSAFKKYYIAGCNGQYLSMFETLKSANRADMQKTADSFNPAVFYE